MSQSVGTPTLQRRRRRTILIATAVTLIVLLVVAYGANRIVLSPSWQVAGDLVSRVKTDDRVVALTLDDGPADADAHAVLDELADRNASATFYISFLHQRQTCSNELLYREAHHQRWT